MSEQKDVLAQGATTCECGFAKEACATNLCMRKKVHLAGLTPGSKWPEGAPIGEPPAQGASGCDQAYDDWSWNKQGTPVGLMLPNEAARSGFFAGAKWAAARTVPAELSPCAWTGYAPQGDDNVLVRVWGFYSPPPDIQDVRLLYSESIASSDALTPAACSGVSEAELTKVICESEGGTCACLETDSERCSFDVGVARAILQKFDVRPK
ncbi:hypothetical protein ABIB86_000388 [Bradyrhizobium sp. JR1.7]|uniref:hypothetical protein n=1 Tax=unclassified Bradyrhizobium TaxID=2631580 RepID=UPI00339ACF2B